MLSWEATKMKLYLIQHGLAKSKGEDPNRPLNEQGWAETKKIATLIATVGNIKPSKIIHSGKTRARQTAEIIAEHLELSNKLEQVSDMAPMDDPSIWLGKIKGYKEDIMLVGHLPHLAKLAGNILVKNEDSNIVRFRNSGIVCLERDENGTWSIAWFVGPQVLP